MNSSRFGGSVLALDAENEESPLEMPVSFNGRSYCATIATCDNGWRVDLRDEEGSVVPGSGDFAATLLALGA